MKHTSVAEREALRLELEQKLNELNEKSKQASEELVEASAREELLRKELEDARAEAAAIAADRAAVQAAAKDGEEMTNKKLEDALAKQRATFDESLTAEKQNHSLELKEVERKLKDVAEGKIQTEAELSSLKEELASLNTALEKSETVARKATETLKEESICAASGNFVFESRARISTRWYERRA